MVEVPLQVAPGLGVPDVTQLNEPWRRLGELVNVMDPAGQFVVTPPEVLPPAGMLTTPLDGTE